MVRHKKQYRKQQLMTSLYGKYSIKQYTLPAHIFQLIRRRYRRKNKVEYGYNYFCQTPIHIFSEGNIQIFPDEPLEIYRPKRTAHVPQDNFLVVLFDGRAVIKVPNEIQFLICLKARPLKL